MSLTGVLLHGLVFRVSFVFFILNLFLLSHDSLILDNLIFSPLIKYLLVLSGWWLNLDTQRTELNLKFVEGCSSSCNLFTVLAVLLPVLL